MKNFSSIIVFFTVYFISYIGFAQNPALRNTYNDRIEQQEIEIRRLTGDVERLRYTNKNLTIKLKGLRKEFDLVLKDFDQRINLIENKITPSHQNAPKKTLENKEGKNTSPLQTSRHLKNPTVPQSLDKKTEFVLLRNRKD